MRCVVLVGTDVELECYRDVWSLHQHFPSLWSSPTAALSTAKHISSDPLQISSGLLHVQQTCNAECRSSLTERLRTLHLLEEDQEKARRQFCFTEKRWKQGWAMQMHEGERCRSVEEMHQHQCGDAQGGGGDARRLVADARDGDCADARVHWGEQQRMQSVHRNTAALKHWSTLKHWSRALQRT